MKNILLTCCILSLFSCNQANIRQITNNADTTVEGRKAIGLYGNPFEMDTILDVTSLPELLNTQNSIDGVFKGKIESSCTHTGCWMDVILSSTKKMHVTFTNDKFTIPLDAAGKIVTFAGKASISVIPVNILKNKAKYEKKTEAEIDAIKVPDTTYVFVASGVKLK